MTPFEFLDHTSEAKFRAYGKTLEECFENSARALFSIMVSLDKVKSKVKINFEVESEDLKSLLFDFLEELIILKDSEGFLLKEIKVEINEINKTNKKYKLKAHCSGDKVGNYETGADVKAVTYDDMKVEKSKSEWMTQVVVDV